MPRTNPEPRELRLALEREADPLSRLAELEVWFRVRSRKGNGNGANADDYARILLDVYQKAVGRLLGQAALELTTTDSAAQHEVMDRFDAAWRELANR